MQKPRFRRNKSLRFAGLLTMVGLAASCSSDFNTKRSPPSRGTLGREIFTVLCDRVGANALREDVTGASFRAVCRPDADGTFAEVVDTSLLPPLDPGAYRADGTPVSLEEQEAHRRHRVARIEALARHRTRLISAFDAILPDESVAIRNAGGREAPLCTEGGVSSLPREVARLVGRTSELQNDGTFPAFTRALASILATVRTNADTREAMSRIEARQGYRPNDVVLGAARALLTYPRLVELANSLLRLVSSDSDPGNPAGAIDPSLPLSQSNRAPIPGAANEELLTLLAVLQGELREPAATTSPPLVTSRDSLLPARELLSRPRTNLEVLRSIFFREDPAFASPTPDRTKYLTRRDARGYAEVVTVQGKVPAPFVDKTGPAGKPDGLADVDSLGQFVTQTGDKAPTPFPNYVSPQAKRETADPGRALGADGKQLYATLDVSRTVLGALARDLGTLTSPDPVTGKDTILKLIEGGNILFGTREPSPSSSKTYPAVASDLDAWLAFGTEPPPPGLGTEPVTVPYRAFQPDTSPLLDLVYALGQLAASPAMDDTLELVKRLASDHPDVLARLVGMGLQIKKIADAHPEASIPKDSTFWDNMFDVFVKIVQEPDVLEGIIRSLKDDKTVSLQQDFANFIEYRDEFSHQDSEDLATFNGALLNRTTKRVENWKTPVDRSKPDSWDVPGVGDNRSQLQRFMQLLHDARGLSACTKEGAVIPIVWKGIELHYPPQSVSETVALGSACAFLGLTRVPSHLSQCEMLAFDDVAQLVIDVALGQLTFTIYDKCLDAIFKSGAANLIGGVDQFLYEISGIDGLKLQPTVSGISRLVWFDAPSTQFPNMPSRGLPKKTRDFIGGVLEPIPTMVCKPLPPVTNSAGKTLHLRRCDNEKDTLRIRDRNSLFPLAVKEPGRELETFIGNIRPLASTFRKRPDLFVELFDKMHMHWGSRNQPKELCDPKADKVSDARYCTQDGLVSYEPLFVEILRKTDVLRVLADVVPIVEKIEIASCVSYDKKTGACLSAVKKDGVTVLADKVRLLVDPVRNAGLKDRKGRSYATRNDGSRNAQVTPIYLLIDALKGIDATFEKTTGGAQKQQQWRQARSDLVDTFLAVKGTGTASSFKNPTLVKALPGLIEVFQSQLSAHCPDRASSTCAWARTELARKLGESIQGPTFAASMDLLEAIRKNDSARVELLSLLQYVLSPSSPTDAHAATLAALADALQVLSDDTNMQPLYSAVAAALSPPIRDESGKVIRRSLADSGIVALSRLLARTRDEEGNELCGLDFDPNGVLPRVLALLVTPLGKNEPAPIELFLDAAADVNRADPSASDKLRPEDYDNIAKEVLEFLTDKGSGLEQIYEVVRQATAGP